MLRDIFTIHADLLNGISSVLPFQHVALLSRVNRFCRERMGKTLWDDRYDEIMRACPWASEPQLLQVRRPLAPGQPYLDGQRVRTHEMRWKVGTDGASFVVLPHGSEVAYTIPMFPDAQVAFVQQTIPVASPATEFSAPPRVTVEEPVTDALVRGNALELSSTGYWGVLAVGGDERFGVAQTSESIHCRGPRALTFYSRADNRLLRHFGSVAGATPALHLITGVGLWIVDERYRGCVLYYGPRADKRPNEALGGRLFPAQLCAWRGDVAGAMRVFRRIPVDARLHNDETPLIALARGVEKARGFEWMDAVETLLRDGADVNARERRGFREALAFVLSKGLVRQIKLLLERGAHASKGAIGRLVHKALEHPTAVQPSTKEILLLLIAHGGSIDGMFHTSTARSRTPLMMAAAASHAGMVAFLLDKCGADPAIVGRTGETALSVASGAVVRDVLRKRGVVGKK